MNEMADIKNHFESEAEIYDDIIIKLIPFYDEMIEAVLLSIPFAKNDSFNVLDLGCGTGTISKAIKLKYKNAVFSLVDIAGNMLSIAKNKIGEQNIQSSENENFYKLQFESTYDVIVSSLALHHLVTDEDKKSFYMKIFNALNPEGVFMNADIILGSNDHLQTGYIEKWIQFMNIKCDMDEINS